MSSTATSSQPKKGGRGKNKRFWTSKEDDVLVDFLLELYRDPKWRTCGYWLQKWLFAEIIKYVGSQTTNF